MSRIPSEFTAGDTVIWVESSIPLEATAATAYLRTNAAQGATISGLNTDEGWEFTLPSNVSVVLPAREDWTAQVVATVEGAPRVTSTVQFTIRPSLAYTGSPAAIDLRTQAQRDLETVEAAIRSLTAGAQEYRVGFGNQGRTVRRADLADLIAWRDRLKAEVAAEQRAAAGLSDRGVYVRFTPWD